MRSLEVSLTSLGLNYRVVSSLLGTSRVLSTWHRSCPLYLAPLVSSLLGTSLLVFDFTSIRPISLSQGEPFWQAYDNLMDKWILSYATCSGMYTTTTTMATMYYYGL
jgi:hypothetical protein